MSGYRVEVEGLAEFRRALRRVSSDAAKTLRVALNSVADLIITEARQEIPRRTGAAAASLKAASTGTTIRIRVGGRKAPYYPWLDFGGKTGKSKSVVRRFYSEGRYLYPTLRRERDRFDERLETALQGTADAAGLERT